MNIHNETPYEAMELPESVVRGRRFWHSAMATYFEIIVPTGQNDRYVLQAVREAFEQVDHLESQLSRFIANSDISRINNIKSDNPVIVGLETFECLQIALDMAQRTGGAFDITIGYLLDCWLAGDKTMRQPTESELEFARKHTGWERIRLDRDYITVQLDKTPMRIDLGGVAKGYTIDQIVNILLDWEIVSALVHGGTSSLRALAAPPDAEGWPVVYNDPSISGKPLGQLSLVNKAMSGSALEQGMHIIDPRTAQPAVNIIAAWVCGPNAAVADALSTAFMIMTEEQIRHYCLNDQDVSGLVVRNASSSAETKRDRIVAIGPWLVNGR